MLMTDQDHDGSHIKGLFMNFLDHFWPQLLRHNGFLCEFVTPIVKARKGSSEVQSFYTIPEYENWHAGLSAQERGAWSIKYYKGLGTSTAAEARQYFQAIEQHTISFQHAEEDGQPASLGTRGGHAALDLAFNKQRAEDRKDWLRSLRPDTYVDHREREVLSFKQFVNEELILFSASHNLRSIASMVDGLKPGQRKVLWCALHGQQKELKVGQLAGLVSERAAYHHGEASLHSTIVNMAQDFVGANNLPLLDPVGQFGTRLAGGKDAASARYIFTKAALPLVRTIFRAEDDAILEYRLDDGQSVEPHTFLPVIPMILVNGCEGVGTGWSTSVPKYHPLEVLQNVRRCLDGEEQLPMQPWYNKFRGRVQRRIPVRSIAEGASTESYVTQGVLEEMDPRTVRITELPIGRWTEDYKRILDNFPGVVDYQERHTEHHVDFLVKFETAAALEALKTKSGGILHALKLETSIPLSNMHMYDREGLLKRFDTPLQVVEEFVDLRLPHYERRRLQQLGVIETQLAKDRTKLQFLQLIVEGHVQLAAKPVEVIVGELRAAGLECPDKTIEGLLQTPLRSLSSEAMNDAQKAVHKLEDKAAKLQATDAVAIWQADLSNAEEGISAYLAGH